MTDMHSDDDPSYPTTHVQRRHFSPVWIIPIIAAILAAYLGWHDYGEHGPLITVTFKTAHNLIAGQTQVRYKAVSLGIVEDIKLADDQSKVIVNIRMTSAAKPLLTNHAKFWVVRPQLGTLNPSDIETLVTGSYIQLEPGTPDGHKQNHFTGLESPPVDRSGEPGESFIIKTDKLGAIGIGSPIYFRDINAGEVLGYDIGDGFGSITVKIFIHAPYDKLVREKSLFWNASGLSVDFGPNGLNLELHSIRSVLTGGIDFETPIEAANDPSASANSVFFLYEDKKAAEAARYSKSLLFAAYFQASVKDLAPGSPVMIYGLQVGDVTGVKLIYDSDKNEPKVRVDFELQPDRAFGQAGNTQAPDANDILHRLIDKGMRVKLESSNFLLGQKMLTLEFVPNATPATIIADGNVTVLPSTGSGEDLTDAITDVAHKLNQIPFDQIGGHLDHLVKTADQTLGGQEMQQAVHSLSVAMANAEKISHEADQNLTPALQKLPDISAQLQGAVTHANSLMSSMDTGYGDGSDFQRNVRQTLDEVNDAARSIRLLADFLERHPEAVLSGKSYEKAKQ